MTWQDLQKKTQEKLNEVSPSFCLAKWMQVTLHLQTGFTHSCHHPVPHKIPLEELQADCSALHNTKHKKKMRKMMLEGNRPSECCYCWFTEDSSKDRFSDRVIKSSDEWAFPYFDEIKNLDWNDSVDPSYLEVSFSSLCNLGCIYCSPDVSSTIWKDFEKNGAFQTLFPENQLDILEAMGKKPYEDDDKNPYVQAFWKWLPQIQNRLKVFRITGGEPLLNSNTFKMLEYIGNAKMGQLQLSINSNLMLPKKTFDQFIEKINTLFHENAFSGFMLYASVDSFGSAAEAIRHGLQYKKFFENLERYLAETELPVTIMVTYTILSATRSFVNFLGDYLKLKEKYTERLILDISYIHQPEHLSVKLLDEASKALIWEQLQFMKSNDCSVRGAGGFYDYEINKMERVYNVACDNELDKEKLTLMRYNFRLLVDDYCARRKLNFVEVFPDLENFYSHCGWRSVLPYRQILLDDQKMFYYQKWKWRHFIVRSQTGHRQETFHPEFLKNKHGWYLRTNPATLEELNSKGEYRDLLPDISKEYLPIDKQSPLSLELSLNSTCSNSCVYCAADESSAIEKDLRENGSMEIYDWRDELFALEKAGKKIINETNDPLVNDLIESGALVELVVTGGEPFEGSEWKKIIKRAVEANPHLDKIIIESSLSKKVFTDEINSLQQLGQKITIITTMDSFGDQGNYIRSGVDYMLWKENVVQFLEFSEVTVRVNYSLLSIGSHFIRLLDDFISLRKQFGKAIRFEFNHLYKPRYLCIDSTVLNIKKLMEQQFQHIKDSNVFFGNEISDFEIMIGYCSTKEEDDPDAIINCANFYQFFRQYDQRRGCSLTNVFPELFDYYQLGAEYCKKLYGQRNE